MRQARAGTIRGKLRFVGVGIALAVGIAGMGAAAVTLVTGLWPAAGSVVRGSGERAPLAPAEAADERARGGRDREVAVGPRGDVLERLRALRSSELESEILRIARVSVEAAVQGKPVHEGLEGQRPDRPSGPVETALAERAGVFVSLILDGSVRGCMGTLYPMEPSLDREIASAARMAARSDRRHPPLRPGELPDLEFCVSVVGRLKGRQDESEIDPRREGVMVRANGRTGIILPGEARTAAYQVSWAKREAGVGLHDEFELWVFETERFGKALPLRR